MQRVDLALERRLREAIAAAVIEQTRTLGPLLREEIELVVRETVSQAFAEQLEAGSGGGLGGHPCSLMGLDRSALRGEDGSEPLAGQHCRGLDVESYT